MVGWIRDLGLLYDLISSKNNSNKNMFVKCCHMNYVERVRSSKSTFQIWFCSCVYLVVEQFRVVSQPRHHLSLGAAVVVSLSFSYLAQLFVQGFFLQLELLGVACLHPQLSLQSPHYPVFCLQLIHLQGLRVTRW